MQPRLSLLLSSTLNTHPVLPLKASTFLFSAFNQFCFLLISFLFHFIFNHLPLFFSSFSTPLNFFSNLNSPNHPPFFTFRFFAPAFFTQPFLFSFLNSPFFYPSTLYHLPTFQHPFFLYPSFFTHPSSHTLLHTPFFIHPSSFVPLHPPFFTHLFSPTPSHPPFPTRPFSPIPLHSPFLTSAWNFFLDLVIFSFSPFSVSIATFNSSTSLPCLLFSSSIPSAFSPASSNFFRSSVSCGRILSVRVL